MKFHRLSNILACALLCLLGGCATTDTPTDDGADAAAENTSQAAIPEGSGRVTMTVNNAPIGDLVRAAGAISGGGIVLINGVEQRPVENLTFRETPVQEVARKLAAGADLQVEENPGYSFLYPEGYESLLALDPESQIAPDFEAPEAALAFGANTSLFNVFAALSRTLESTIVADNAVADARSGELALPAVDLGTALRAILQSARVPSNGYVLKSTDEYVFLASPQNADRKDSLLNGDALTTEQEALLDERVTLVLPDVAEVPEHLAMVTGAKTLAEILPVLSLQMGLPVNAAAELMALPVNYTVVHKVRRRTAMNLLLWQWLQHGFGYELRPDGTIYIRPV